MEDVGALFGDERVEDDGVVVYGRYALNVAPKEGRANTLLADQLFSPALLLAEQIELGRVPVAGRTVLELGAGTGLPSLLAVAHGAAKVVASDYPDDLILRTLSSNVVAAGVRVAPFEWGTDPTALLQVQHAEVGFEVVILSDLLHFASSHPDLLSSVCALLKRSPDARVFVACGRYTPDAVCARFVEGARARGVLLDEDERICGEEAQWEVASTLRGVGREGMAARKRNCRLWEGRWTDL